MAEKNELIEPENFFAGYEQSMQEARMNPDVIEFDKLCFNVLGMTEDGKALLELFKERFIIPATPCALNGPYQNACIYYEGYRDAFRMIIASVKGYTQRKNHEAEQVRLQAGDSKE